MADEPEPLLLIHLSGSTSIHVKGGKCHSPLFDSMCGPCYGPRLVSP